MKTALLLTGHLRHFERSVPTIIDHLIKPLNADVYAWVWSDVGNKFNDSGAIDPLHPGTESNEAANFSKFRSYIPNVHLSINDYSRYHTKFVERSQKIIDVVADVKFSNKQYHRPTALNSQWFTWMMGYQMIEESNIEYDLVIRARPDLSMIGPFRIPDEMDRLYLFHPGGNRNHQIGEYFELQDLLVYGAPDYVKKYCSLYEKWLDYINLAIQNDINLEVVYAPHLLYNFHLTQMNLDFEQVENKSHVCREPLCGPCRNLWQKQQPKDT